MLKRSNGTCGPSPVQLIVNNQCLCAIIILLRVTRLRGNTNHATFEMVDVGRFSIPQDVYLVHIQIWAAVFIYRSELGPVSKYSGEHDLGPPPQNVRV